GPQRQPVGLVGVPRTRSGGHRFPSGLGARRCAFDGPLGVACALAAVDELRSRGFSPARPLAIGVFVEEEGGRFGVPCVGSRLMAGEIDPERVRGLTDASGLTWAEAMAAAGPD